MDRDVRGCQMFCPTCGRLLIGDYDKGELVCSSCGFVIEDHSEYRGPEWKALDLEEKEKRVRVGAPQTFLLHDLGLTTEIGSENKDSHGKPLSPYMHMSVKSMKKWQSRIRTVSSEERNLCIVLSKINEVSDALKLPKIVTETAAHSYRILAKKGVAKSRSIIGMAGASIYLSCRKFEIGRSLKEIAKAMGVDKRTVAKYYRFMRKESEKEHIPPTSVGRYVSKLVNVMKIDPKVERLALNLMSQTFGSKTFDGKAPAGLAAAFVYISSVLLGERTPQREIAEAAEVTEVTVRNRSREILNNFLIRQRLKVLPKGSDAEGRYSLNLSSSNS
ncbi:MAG: TFIIB-type zinc ribbon-containing protein [Nitrososphaerales archaeon]